MQPADSPPRITVRQLALRLKVSHTTVSRALHNDPRISLPVREQVKRLAKELGYRPDPLLSALSSYRLSKRQTPIRAELAWINCWPEPDKLRTFKEFDLYWRGASKEAELAGYRLEPFNCPQQIPPGRLATILHARNIRGLLLTPSWAGINPDWADFPWQDFSAVRFGYSLEHPAVHVVTTDQLLAGMMAFENIWNLGYRRIAMVTARRAGTRVVHFSAGYLFGQLKVAPKFLIVPYLGGEVDSEQEERRFATWLKKAKPDAILTDRRNMPELLARCGLRVPRDIGLAALSVLDGQASAGIDQHSEEVGAAAVQMLISQINHHQTGIPKVPRELLIAGCWVNGHSLPPKSPRLMAKQSGPSKHRRGSEILDSVKNKT
jgi:LacI family transcriptional regulator